MVQTAYDHICGTGMVAILRGIEESHLEAVMDALYAGGVRCVEITMNTPGALRLIEKAAAGYRGRVSIGAGTVLEETSARLAILAGADFVLAPTLSIPMIEMCALYNCLAVPGAFSPTEVLQAWRAGARIVKVFPCGSVGPRYIKELKGPLAQVRMMAVGGVNLDTAGEFFKAGVCSLGVGASLFDPKLAREGRYDEIQHRAAEFMAIAGKHVAGQEEKPLGIA